MPTSITIVIRVCNMRAWGIFGKSSGMFSIQQKREIAEGVQKLLRATNHPELPPGEIAFELHVDGAEDWSFADIRNNGAVKQPGVNPWNEAQDPRNKK